MQSIEEKHRGIGRNKRVNKSLICICVVTTAMKIVVFTSSFNLEKQTITINALHFLMECIVLYLTKNIN